MSTKKVTKIVEEDANDGVSEGIGLPEGFTAVDYTPPGLAAAESTVIAAEADVEDAKEAVEAQEKINVNDVVAESAARRAAANPASAESIAAAEKVRLETEAQRTPDADGEPKSV